MFCSKITRYFQSQITQFVLQLIQLRNITKGRSSSSVYKLNASPLQKREFLSYWCLKCAYKYSKTEIGRKETIAMVALILKDIARNMSFAYINNNISSFYLSLLSFRALILDIHVQDFMIKSSTWIAGWLSSSQVNWKNH